MRRALKYTIRCSKSLDPAEFLRSIREVYQSTPDSLRQIRDMVTYFSRMRLPTMLKDSTIAAMYDEVTRDVPDYTRDLLQLYVKDRRY